MRDPHNVLIRPVVSEKSYALMDNNVYVFVVDPSATKIDVRRAVEEAFNVRVDNVNTLNRKGKTKRQPQEQHRSGTVRTPSGPSSPSTRATRSTCSRTEDRDQTMPLRSRKPTSAGRRFQTVSDFAEITRDRPEKSLLAPKPSHRWPQQLRPQDLPAPRRRPQAAVPDHRLQAEQGRRSGQGGRHRVRPQPQRPHRPAPLPGRREALHPGPGPGAGGRPAPVRARAPRSAPATPCPCATSRSARSSTTSSSGPAAAGSWPGGRA